MPETYFEVTMTASEIISQLQTLEPEEVAKVCEWLNEKSAESPALLTAVDAGLRALERNGGRIVNRAELEGKVRQWSGGSH